MAILNGKTVMFSPTINISDADKMIYFTDNFTLEEAVNVFRINFPVLVSKFKELEITIIFGAAIETSFLLRVNYGGSAKSLGNTSVYSNANSVYRIKNEKIPHEDNLVAISFSHSQSKTTAVLPAQKSVSSVFSGSWIEISDYNETSQFAEGTRVYIQGVYIDENL